MAKRGNPWDIPEWHSIGRESMLVRHLIGSGVSALGKANYADQIGEYYTAFFSLSVGLERICKLVLVADYVITNNGQMPPEAEIRQYGHNLSELMGAVEEVEIRRQLKLQHARPKSTISVKIIECLDAFSDARRGRYANYSALGNPNLGAEEPIQKWWGEVAEHILKHHYYGKPIQKKVEHQAGVVDAVMSPVSAVLHINESGDVMQDLLSTSIRAGQTELVQRFGRFYTLIVVRWLSEVFSELSRLASEIHGFDAFFGAWEVFYCYIQEDSFLKTRKKWPAS